MHPRRFPEIALRLTFFWVLVSVLGLLWGRRLLELLLPLFDIVITVAQEDFAPTLEIVSDSDGEISLKMTALSVQNLHLAGAWYIQGGVTVSDFNTTLFHMMVPAVLLLTPLLAWPVIGWREALIRATAGIPAFLGVMLTTTPFFLIGRFDMYLSDQAARVGERPSDTWMIHWAIFTEMGGRWLLPIVAATVCILFAQRQSDAARQTTGGKTD